MTNIANRPLTAEEWERRLGIAERSLAVLEEQVAALIVAVDTAGDTTGLDSRERLNVIHTAHGTLGSLKSQAQLARRRIERDLV